VTIDATDEKSFSASANGATERSGTGNHVRSFDESSHST